jgi:cytochrome c oxidase assembly protein subunit 15
MCNGEVVPRAPAVATLIEFGHRASSGIALLLVVALVVWAVRALPAGHPARRAAWVALAFMIAEALVGAGLVLFGWVAKDTSAARGWVMAIHLTNTFLLLGALALSAEWSARPGGLALAGRSGLAREKERVRGAAPQELPQHRHPLLPDLEQLAGYQHVVGALQQLRV